MLFNEAHKDRIYYWMLDPKSDGEDRKEGEDYYFNLCYFKYGSNEEQKPIVEKRFNTKHVNVNSEVFNNKGFSKLVMFDGADYRSPMVFDIEKGTTEHLKVGTDLIIAPNPWTRESPLIYYQDHLSKRWIYDVNKQTKTKSTFEGWYFRVADATYSED